MEPANREEPSAYVAAQVLNALSGALMLGLGARVLEGAFERSVFLTRFYLQILADFGLI